MAEETKADAAVASSAVVEAAVVSEEEKKVEEAPAAVKDVEKKEAEEEVTGVEGSGSFEEESSKVSDLSDTEKKALEELKKLVSEALVKREFTAPPPGPAKEPEKAEEAKLEEQKMEEAEKESPKEKTEEEPKAAEEPPKAANEAPKAADEAPKAAEEAPKAAEEAPKAAEEAPKATEEPKVVEETKTVEETKPEEPKVVEQVKPEEPKVVEAPKADEPKVVEEAKVAEEPKTETGVVEEKTVEAIAETVVELAAAGPSAEPSSEPPPAKEEAPVPVAEPEEVDLWGVRLLEDEKSDVVLLKFLRARDFKVKDALSMLKNTCRWRKEFDIEAILGEDLGNDLDSVVFTHGVDREGHPVCYNVYGEFQKKELYDKAFADAEKRQRFLRWRIQFLEKSIRNQLDFTPGGVCTIVQVNDLKSSPGPAKWELRQTTNQALHLLQDNYPEFVAKQVFVNVPWWYLAFNRMISPFLTQRTKSKFVFAGPSKSAETLFRYIAPEQVPIQYGGLSDPSNPDFSTADPVTDITIKPASKYTVEVPAAEACSFTWELRVIGWDVSYGAEFVPGAEDGYTVIVSKTAKLSPTDEPVIKNSFKVGEPGKVVLTIDNTSSKKKKLLYRSKTKAASE